MTIASEELRDGAYLPGILTDEGDMPRENSGPVSPAPTGEVKGIP
ncbi:MAG: hypothetical protein WBB00_02475 [Mycobacterium sp.]